MPLVDYLGTLRRSKPGQPRGTPAGAEEEMYHQNVQDERGGFLVTAGSRYPAQVSSHGEQAELPNFFPCHEGPHDLK